MLIQGVNIEMINACEIGIRASSREAFSTKTLFSNEASYPSALFDEKGELRSTSKSVLKNKIEVESSQRNRVLLEASFRMGVLYCGLYLGLHHP